MSEQSATPESGSLSVEQAIASLTPEPPVEQETPAAEPVEAAAGDENTEGEASAPEEAEDGAETPAEDAEAEADEPAVEPLDPPKYWSQDAKAKFAELPPELQAVVLEQEGPREQAAAKVKAEAAEISKQAQAEMGKAQQLAEALADRLPKWVENFTSRWGTQTPDWVAYAHEHGVETMTLAKTQFEQEAQQLSEASKLAEIAGAQAHETYVKAEFAKLQDLAPELVDPEKGPERRSAVAQYLTKQGIAADSLKNISATEMVLARKAMRWDEAQAQLKAAPKPKPSAPAKAAPVRPAAAQAQSPTQRSATQVANRFAQTRSVDDAVALLLAKKA